MKIMVFRIPKWYAFFTSLFFTSILALAYPPAEFLTNTSPQTQPQAIYRGNPVEKKVAFACNVFWGEEYLPQMLEVLERENVQVTFFIGGSWANRHPDTLKAIHAKGHELGNHTYSHPHPNALGRQENKDQIVKTEQLVEQLTGYKTQLYAPPYGEFNELVLAAAHELGYKTIMWTIDTIDWKRPPSEVIIGRVTKKLQSGAIILMHPTDPTAKALSELIKQIKQQGYQVTTVSNVLH